jgi:signal transduction histidine kinase
MADLSIGWGRRVAGAAAGSPWSRIAALVLACGLLLLLLARLLDVGSNVQRPGVQQFTHAALVAAGNGESPIRCEDGECARRYHLVFHSDPAAHGALSLYVPQYTGNLRVEFNDVPIASRVRRQTWPQLAQGVPLIVALPSRLLQPDGNDITLVFESHDGMAGFAGDAYLGPEPQLRAGYMAAWFIMVLLPRLIDGVLFAIGAIMLLIWFNRRHEQLYLLCAAISMGFAAASLSSETADSLGMLLLPANVARYLCASLILPFAWQLAGRTPPLRTRWFLLLPALLFACLLCLPNAVTARLLPGLFLPLVMVTWIIAIVELARTAIRTQSLSSLLTLGAIGMGLVLTVRDQLVIRGVLDGGHVLMARFNGPILAMMTGAVLTRRFSSGLAALEDFNARLRNDVNAAAEQLRRAFEREQVQARRATLEAERMRLMGDLHDGIAGHLVSIISLCEQAGGGVTPEIAQASHRALTDLRLVVDSMEDVGDDLGMMLGAFRERVEPQLRRAGLRLEWHVRDLPDLPGLYPGATLAIFRILQEAVGNAVRHSGARAVEVSAGPSPLPEHGVRLLVRDQGRGGAAVRRGGYGMDNMRRRAEAFGGVLAVESDAAGTRVLLDLPRQLKAESAGA